MLQYLVGMQTKFVILINILFTKLLWPGDSELGTLIRSSSQAITCPVPTCLPHTVEALHCPFLWLNVKKESWNTNFYSCWLTRPEITPYSTVSVADVLFARPLII